MVVDLDALLRDHSDRIYAVCRRITGNDADAADAMQEAMIAVVRGIDRFDGRSLIQTWIYRITVNACLDELRRRKRRPTPLAPTALHDHAVGTPTSAVDDRLDVDAALATLPQQFRVAVVLRDLCDLDYAEIAAVLRVPVGAVRSRIARGRAALVPLLSGNQPAPAERPKRTP